MSNSSTENVKLPSEGFVRIDRLIKPHGVFPVGRSALYEAIRNGQFPAPKKILGNVSAWDVREVRAKLESLSQAI